LPLIACSVFVEVVRDAARHRAERFHFQALTQLRLHRDARGHGFGDLVFETARQFPQGLFGDPANVNVDDDAGKAHWCAGFVVVASAGGENPGPSRIAGKDAVFGAKRLAVLQRAHDKPPDAFQILGMDLRERRLDRHAARHLVERKRKRAREALIAFHAIVGNVPHERAEHRAGIERELQALIGFAKRAFGFGARAFEQHAPGRFDDDREHADGHAFVRRDRAVMQIEPHLRIATVARQRKAHVAIRKRFSAQSRIEHIAIELGRLGPRRFDRHAENARMTPARKTRVCVVIEQRAFVAP
jgi:hypothetical protein